MTDLRCQNSSLYAINSGVYVGARGLLLFPLSVLVLCLGHQRWRRRRSSAPSSHSDAFTHHMAAVELLWGVAMVFIYGPSSGRPLLAVAGSYLLYLHFFAQVFLHLITCAERYLAAVHPVTYRGLRSARGVRLRKLCVGGVYALALLMSLASLQRHWFDPLSYLLFLLVSALAAISFFSLSVLRVLIRPGPGKVGGARGRVDASRQRAFLTILAVMAALWLWFLGLLAPSVLRRLQLDVGVACAVETSCFWLGLPSGLVLHLLYLHRARKLPCCPARG